jgi:2-dehydro-3-deoxy-D-arabinonate dehydratase
MRIKIGDEEVWSLNGINLPNDRTLSGLLELSKKEMIQLLTTFEASELIQGDLLVPIEPHQEVWAAGVTYLRSREARREESGVGDLYNMVYDAKRPELFFKALGWRVVGDGEPIRIRADSSWNVPEPELVLVVNSHNEIVGYTAGNDVSSREIEGENPLYLPQAKVYRGSCALGPAIQICDLEELIDLTIRMEIERDGQRIFDEASSTSALKRTFTELVDYLTSELDFPQGVFLMTGTSLVPGGGFSLGVGDLVRIHVGELTLENVVST